MTTISHELVTEACTIKPRVNTTVQPSWNFHLNKTIEKRYSFTTAQMLLELSHRVAVHNREVNDGVKDPVKIDPPGFDVVFPLTCTYMYVNVNVGWFLYSTQMNIVIFVATATYNNVLSIIDLNYPQMVPKVTNLIPNMKVHGGFWTLYERIQDKLHRLLNEYVNDDTQVMLTGMSLGGATSTIAALDLYGLKLDNAVITDLIHYSFASPRLFNTTGAQAYKDLQMKSYQVHNGSDIIPVVPLPIMPFGEDFMHVGNLQYFDRNLGSYYDNHILAYLLEYNVKPIE